MRPMRLDLAGFAVFRDETTIDFTDADFFALVGPTGAGKSTVLDAICFALYGTVPRWSDRRAVANALAPSANEARVRLIFESAGLRYVATRVVRRDARGRVSTSHAGLELLPPGFDISRLDTGLTVEDLGEVLAGTPAAMEAAVLAAIGLPYEQFTSCVILPQGAFAEFLHAKPAARQEILVNLLGLGIYERIRDAATARAARADAQLTATDPILAGYADVTDEAITAAAARVDRMRLLVIDVEALLPRLAEARARAQRADEALTEIDEDIDCLDTVRVPADLSATTATLTAARQAVTEAEAAMLSAEDREEKSRGELAAAGDPTALRRLLDSYTDVDRLVRELDTVRTATADAQAEVEKARAAVTTARTGAEKATAGLREAAEAMEEARTADRAAALRPHLRVGHECPVCTQVVEVLPEAPDSATLASATTALTAATTADQAATTALKTREQAAHALETTLAAAHGRRDAISTQLAEVTARVATAPSPDVLRRELAAIAAQRDALDAAGAALRAARESHRAQIRAAEQAAARMAGAWRAFDTARDAVARFSPPSADRDDLSGAWQTLASWAGTQLSDRREVREGRLAAAEAATEVTAQVAEAIEEKFTEAAVPAPLGDPGVAAAVAVTRSEEQHAALLARRADREALIAQRAAHERDGRVAKALANHLRANNFERWLLEEALDRLVDGASQTLRELSGGQYDLVHDKGEFFVVDHYDAALRRAVRTLSGGETFQASLALALALSEQLSGMSTGAASLESIVLDEGFGTLDATTLDIVAATLENLAAKGDRMVGVVTHINALAERVPVRFEVRKDARTARVERLGGP